MKKLLWFLVVLFVFSPSLILPDLGDFVCVSASSVRGFALSQSVVVLPYSVLR
jgi:hypothetical protein